MRLYGENVKLMESYKSIYVPAEPDTGQDNQYDVGIEAESEKCVLRFPFFKKVWADDRIDFYENDTLDRFPEIVDVWSMLKADAYNEFPMSPGDAYFWNRLKSCSAREIYFLDSYFSANSLARLWGVLNDMDRQYDRQMTDVRLYTVAGHEWGDLKKEFEAWRKEKMKFEKITLAICRLDVKLSGKMHDRFVLLGKSLWHFGASAGAMHTNINAYSGPWPDKNGKCMEFMRNLRDHYIVEELSTAQIEE